MIERAGTKIHYEVSGHGPAIVFAHSFLCDGSMFAHQVAALQSRWRVINVDLRGHGRSGAALNPVSFYELADDVIAILDAEGVDWAVWAGLSMGGFTALRAVLTRPERVRALVLMDTDAGADTIGNRVQSVLMRGVVRTFGMSAVVSRMMTIMFGRTTLAEQPALCDAYRRRFLTSDMRSMLTVARALSARDNLLPKLGQISCPTLVIVGEEDMALPVELSRRLAAGIRGAELLVVPRVGHLSAVEAPALLTQAIERFVDPFALESQRAA
jgi:pimeloyl-ACP methyl ester carboxylesterase